MFDINPYIFFPFMLPDSFLEMARVLPEPLLLVDAKGNILAANQPAANIFNLKLHELQSQNLFNYSIDEHTKLTNYLQCCSATGNMVIGSLSIRTQDTDDIISYRCHGAALQAKSCQSEAQILLKLESKANAINNFVILNQKIDELAQEIQRRKQAELKLAEVNKYLEHLVEERTQELKTALLELQQTQAQLIHHEKMSSLGKVVAGIAHEINNPVNFIYGNIGCLNNYIKDLLKIINLYQNYYPHPTDEIKAITEAADLEFIQQDLPQLLSSIEIGTQRIQNIVQSLRNFSRLDEAKLKKVDIHKGIDSTLMILQNRLILTSGIEIQVIKQYDNLPLVECYAGQLNQAFMYIISNAIDAIQAKVITNSTSFQPCIAISTSLADNNYITINVKDNGKGISEEVKQNLFDPFFTTKPVGQGIGMGLSICYQIITRQHKGFLECSSSLGEGTDFIIKIPLHQQ